MKKVLEFILLEIRRENDARLKDRVNVISLDDSNEILTEIFHDTVNKFSELDFEIEDDEDKLRTLFGDQGFEIIREAEHGSYGI